MPDNQDSIGFDFDDLGFEPEIVASQPNGFLFANKVFLTTKIIRGRNKEVFKETQIGKLGQIFEIADKQNLVPVFIGGLFDNQLISDGYLLVELFKLLSTAKNKPIIVATQQEESNSAISVVAATGLANIIFSQGYVAEFDFNGDQIDLWIDPSAEPILEKSAFQKNTVCVYQGKSKLQPSSIKNVCQVVVGGDITGQERTARIEDVGAKTDWAFIDCISRLSEKKAFVAPTAWEWRPGAGLTPHTLIHSENPFSCASNESTDLLGDGASENGGDEGESIKKIEALPKSLFVEILVTQVDGQIEIDEERRFADLIEQLMAEMELTQEARITIAHLFGKSSST